MQKEYKRVDCVEMMLWLIFLYLFCCLLGSDPYHANITLTMKDIECRLLLHSYFDIVQYA